MHLWQKIPSRFNDYRGLQEYERIFAPGYAIMVILGDYILWERNIISSLP